MGGRWRDRVWRGSSHVTGAGKGQIGLETATQGLGIQVTKWLDSGQGIINAMESARIQIEVREGQAWEVLNRARQGHEKARFWLKMARLGRRGLNWGLKELDMNN